MKYPPSDTFISIFSFPWFSSFINYARKIMLLLDHGNCYGLNRLKTLLCESLLTQFECIWVFCWIRLTQKKSFWLIIAIFESCKLIRFFNESFWLKELLKVMSLWWRTQKIGKWLKVLENYLSFTSQSSNAQYIVSLTHLFFSDASKISLGIQCWNIHLGSRGFWVSI